MIKVMLMMIVMALGAAGPGAYASSGATVSPPAPTVRCSIVLDKWCLASGPATVSMVDLPHRRMWLVTSPIGMQWGPLVIFSDKTCDPSSALDVSFAGESRVKVAANGYVTQATFRLGKGECELKFQWPAGAANPYSYQEFMAFSVFVRATAHGAFTPLYVFYDKTRCHGVFVKKGLECK